MAINDKDFCSGEKCPLRDNCWRYIQGLGAPKIITEWVAPKYDKETKICENYLGN